MFHPPPSAIYVFFENFQPIYIKLQEILRPQGIDVYFAKATEITEKHLEKMKERYQQTIIVIDDNSQGVATSSKMAQLVTVCRHYNVSFILLMHFLFYNAAPARVIRQNIGN
jgi:hypothetical protein